MTFNSMIMNVLIALLPISSILLSSVLGLNVDTSELRKRIIHFEYLDYPVNQITKAHKRCRRDLYVLKDVNPLLRLPFNAFNRTFSLILFPDADLIHPTAQLTVGGKLYPRGLSSLVDHAYHGYLADHPESSVYGSILNGVFRGVIIVNSSIVGNYFVEPAPYFFQHPTPFHSIIYNEADVVMRQGNRRLPRSASHNAYFGFCGLTNPVIAQKLKDQSRAIPGLHMDAIRSRKKRGASISGVAGTLPLPNSHHANADFYPRTHIATRLSAHSTITGATTRVCNMYLLSDTFLWDRVISMQHIRGDKELAVKEITSIFTQHVQGAQAIYQHTVFRDHAGRFEYPGISFRVDHVLINVTEDDCKPCSTRTWFNQTRSNIPPLPTALPQSNITREGLAEGRTVQQLGHGSCAEDNPFCTANMDVTNFLNLHSYTAHDDFCLAYVFTYRDFHGGTLGLAWVAESSGSGGVCEKHRLMREGSHNVHKSLNTGVVTLMNYGSQVALKVSQLTFAHEVGHNFGAKHDDDHRDEPHGCLPSVDDPRGNYLMFASATSGYKDNNDKFSRCSSDSIATLLHRVLSDDGNCFLTSNGPFCGNQLTEEDEECDCGFKPSDCRDRCCNPKASSAPCKLKQSVWVNHTTVPVQCSPTAGECCTHDCQFRSQSHLCRSAGECYRAAHCSGNEARCPLSEFLPDGTPCQDHTRVCKQGQCLGSICEIIPGWTECSLTRDNHITPEMMCFVSCRPNKTGAQCVSTLQMERTPLTENLLRDDHGTRLKPGAPCDNFRGYCDDFHRCQSVEVQGPLTRMRNLLFSPQVFEKFRIWATMYWWAMILICLGSIIAMIIFMKLCSVSTPRSRYNGRPFPRLLAVDSDGDVPGRLWLTTTPRPPIDSMLNPHRTPRFSSSRIGVVQPSSSSARAPTRWAHDRHENKRKRGKSRDSRSTPPSRSIPTAPLLPIRFLDPMDFPPPHVRQTPIPYKPQSNVIDDNSLEAVSLIPVNLREEATSRSNLVQSSRTNQSIVEQTSSRRHSDGNERQGKQVSRPMSMLATTSPTTASQSGQHKKPNLNLPKNTHRPQSSLISNQPPAGLSQPGFSGQAASNVGMRTLSEPPPPAYNDLPNRLTMLSKQSNK